MKLVLLLSASLICFLFFYSGRWCEKGDKIYMHNINMSKGFSIELL